MALTLRPATAADRDAMVAVSRSVWETDYVAREPERFMAEGEVLLAEEAGALLGFGKWERLPDGSAWVAALRTRPEARRRGIARRITAAALSRAAEAGARPARELVSDQNEASLALARSFGFATAARWGALWREPGAAAAPGGPALVAAAPSRFEPLLGALVFYPGLYYRAVRLTPALLAAFAGEGALFTGPGGERVLRLRRRGEEGLVDYLHVFEPTAAVAGAVARSLDAWRPERGVVVVPWERAVDEAAGFEREGFQKSSWAWGVQVLEKP